VRLGLLVTKSWTAFFKGVISWDRYKLVAVTAVLGVGCG
jgi:hypothetical protein